MSFLVLLLLAETLTLGERRDFESAIAMHLASDSKEPSADTVTSPPTLRNSFPRASIAPRHCGFWESATRRTSRFPRRRGISYWSESCKGPLAVPRPIPCGQLSAEYPLDQKRFLATATPVLILLSSASSRKRSQTIAASSAVIQRTRPASPDGCRVRECPAVPPCGGSLRKGRRRCPGDSSAWRQQRLANLILQDGSRHGGPREGRRSRGRGRGPSPRTWLRAREAADIRAPSIHPVARPVLRDVGTPALPNRPRAHGAGKLEGSEEAFTRAASLNPKMSEPPGAPGDSAQARENELALVTLERAVAVARSTVRGLLPSGEAYWRLGRRKEARKAVSLYEDLERKKRGVSQEEAPLRPPAAGAGRRVRTGNDRKHRHDTSSAKPAAQPKNASRTSRQPANSNFLPVWDRLRGESKGRRGTVQLPEPQFKRSEVEPLRTSG